MSNEISHVASVVPSLYPNLESVRHRSSPAATAAAPTGDVVEFSPLSRSLAEELTSSSFRKARLESIRRQIADGTYETAERITGTVDRLLKALD